MVLIYTDYASFDEYLGGLSKRARQEYKVVEKRNADLDYVVAVFEKDRVARFMDVWGHQLVRGKPIQWAYPVETVESWASQGELLIFEARKGNDVVAMHFIKKEGGMWDTQPPMWDKEHLKERHLGTWLWFRLIRYAIEHKIGILNFGGGIDTSWREMIRRRKEFPNPKYKWRFVQQSVKHNPDAQPDYFIQNMGEKKYLCLN